jgi:AcrR family transcriptional regulator
VYYSYSTLFLSTLELMPETRRTRTPSADMVDALLDAASEILETEGPDALSVRRIAAAAGVAPMGVYNHFDSKNGIIDALFMQGFERLRVALATAIAEIQDPYEALREGGRRYRALALAHPMAYRLMFLRTIPGYEPSPAALEVAGRAFDSLVDAVQRAMTAGVLAEAPPTEIAQIIWSSLHGWVSLELTGIGFVEDQDEAFQLVCASLLRGLRP